MRELSVPGALELTPVLHEDARGSFHEWYRADVLEAATGRTLELAQANLSVSAAGVLRGIHVADVPPGQAKLVTCPRGSVLDVVVDLRVGSPTFGRWDAVELDDRTHRSVFVGEGIGHAFLAREDGSVVTYLCSSAYDPAREHTVHPLDPDLAIDWTTTGRDGTALRPTMSARDGGAPSLEEARLAGLLPVHLEVEAFVNGLR